ncbi:MAG: lactate dehydrogenase, partial [Verrucomicrobia bacterium]|nr:lactate dehydrogenase [Verrucomicrobiota bacterium]
GNALRIDWLSICPPTGKGVKMHGDDLFSTPLDQSEIDFENEGGETYICGNPPYKGTREQSPQMKSDLKELLDGRLNGWKSLDYVAGWFVKAAEYGKKTPCVSAFVATNSINQGQQVPILWPFIVSTGHHIGFAHTSFKWSNLASKNAGVTVAIIGLRHESLQGPKKLYVEQDEESLLRLVKNINPYLVDADDIYVRKSTSQIAQLPEMASGDKLTDGGNLVLSQAEADNILAEHGEAKRILGRLYGAQEIIKGVVRYALVIKDDDLCFAKSIDGVSARLAAVSRMRAHSKKEATQEIANTPHRFDETRFQPVRKIVVAQLSSEKREYFPSQIVLDNDVAMAPSLVIYDSDPWIFSLTASRMHLAWIAAVCGKLETRYRYSNVMGWNTFPVPKLTEKNKKDLAHCARDILLAREAHFPATIADLYDPEKMPADLRAAHERNDEVLERIYIGRRFRNDTERLEKLFELYTKMTSAKDLKKTNSRMKA